MYVLRSFRLCFIIGVYHGEFMMQICLEPWVNNWERETRQYFHPNEVWRGYRKVSAIVAFILVYPSLGLHVIIFLANSLTRDELYRLQKYWAISRIWFGSTLYTLLTSEVIGTLRDLSHFDEDVEIVYVPNLNSYVNNWVSLRLSCLLTSQLPLLWLYQRNNRFASVNINYLNNNWNKLQYRFTFVTNFLIPSIISSVRIYDDILLAILWVLILRGIYLRLRYRCIVRYKYRDVRDHATRRESDGVV